MVNNLRLNNLSQGDVFKFTSKGLNNLVVSKTDFYVHYLTGRGSSVVVNFNHKAFYRQVILIRTHK